jgi:hypothetical protein
MNNSRFSDDKLSEPAHFAMSELKSSRFLLFYVVTG